MDNLLRGVPTSLPDELTTTLVASGAARIERIVSTGQASPEGFWYDQEWDEFVLVVQGSAGLQFEGEPVRALTAGDWLVIPARARHRVAWTDPDRPTIWLAVHYRPGPAGAREE